MTKTFFNKYFWPLLYIVGGVSYIVTPTMSKFSIWLLGFYFILMGINKFIDSKN